MNQNKFTRFLLWFSLAFFVIVTVGFVTTKQWRLNWQLAAAIRASDVPEMRELIQQGADPNMEMKVREEGLPFIGDRMPAIEVAALRLNQAAVAELIRQGATVDLQNNKGIFALELSLERDNVIFLDTLLQAEAQQRRLQPPFLQQVLTKAVVADSQKNIKLLVKKGADINGPPAGLSREIYPTFLILAVERNPACLPLLLKLGANPNFKDKQGKTALDYARQIKWPNKRQEAMKALMKPKKK